MVKAGQNEQTRAAALYGVIVHGNEIAGTAYAYLRTKGSCHPRPSERWPAAGVEIRIENEGLEIWSS